MGTVSGHDSVPLERRSSPAPAGLRTAAAPGRAPATPRTAAYPTAVTRSRVTAPGGPRVATRTGTTGGRRPAATRTARAARPSAPREPGRVRRALQTTPDRWKARLGVVAAATVTVMSTVALLPSTQSVPAAAGAPVLDLQVRAATMQADLATAADRYRQLQQSTTDLGVALQAARDELQAARTAADQEQAAVGRFASDLYRAPIDVRNPALSLSADDPAAVTDVLHVQSLAEQLDRDRDRQVARAQHARVEVDRAARAVAVIESRIAAALDEAADVLADIRGRTTGVDTAVSAQLAGMSTATPAADAAQVAADQAALGNWRAYLDRFAAAGVVPPPADELADPGALPAGLSPLLDATGTAVPGVAVGIVGGRPETVLPAETVTAVSSAFTQLGKPYAPGRAGPDAYSCGGLTSAAWTQAGYGVPVGVADQWTQSSSVSTGTLQVGDLVFSADPSGRWSDVGIWLGPGTVLASSATTGQVGVRTQAPGPTAAVRVTLPAPAVPNAQPAVDSDPTTECGAPIPAPEPVDPAWGGHANGRIPAGELCLIGVGQHRLRCDAAAAYVALSAAYATHFGAPLCITDSYRSFAAQQSAHRMKPAITAVPGTSNHGWALAVDLCGGINDSVATPQYQWMAANAGRFGWVHPAWAKPGGENPEPWHWEFGDLADTHH